MLPRRKVHWGLTDTIQLLLLCGLFAYLGYRVHLGLEYRWNWQVIPQYLLRHDEVDGWVPNLLLLGLLTTIRLSFWSLLLALPIGLAAGLMRTSLHLFNRLIGSSYVTLLRNLPPLVLVFIFYFFISDQILPFLQIGERLAQAPESVQGLVHLLLAPTDQLEAFIAAVITLALFEGLTSVKLSGPGSTALKADSGRQPGRGNEALATAATGDSASGFSTHDSATGRAGNLNHQGLRHCLGYFHSRTDFSGHGTDGCHLSDLRSMDHGDAALFYPDLHMFTLGRSSGSPSEAGLHLLT